jgi:CRISPR/Cas system CSM-associated protein Csm2 small subunit
MNEEFNIVTIEDDSAYVTIETLVKFSGNGEKPIKALIRKYESRLESKSSAFSKSSDSFKFPRLSSGTNENSINWSEVKLNERQAMFLLTLMANSEQVVNFKDDMETEFYKYKTKRITPQLSPMEQIQAALALADVEIAKERKRKDTVQKILDKTVTVFDNTHEDMLEEDIGLQELCQILTTRATDVIVGRNTLYRILRSMKLVTQDGRKPTQYGSKTYLDYRHGTHGYSTRIPEDRIGKLISAIIKHLLNNDEMNEALGYPFHPELRE